MMGEAAGSYNLIVADGTQCRTVGCVKPVAPGAEHCRFCAEKENEKGNEVDIRKPDDLISLEQLRRDRDIMPNGKRSVGSKTTLAFMFAIDKSKKLTEIWILVFFFFYLDFGLDMRTAKMFQDHGDVLFCAFTIAGTALGIIFTLAMFQGAVTKSDPPWMLLLCGFLLPFQCHVFFLCVYSTIKLDRAHPLLHSFKLAESALEATVSALVQSYAMIFRSLSAWNYRLTFLSCSLSYASIAFVFTHIDRRKQGLQGLPGLSDGWSIDAALVFLFRICEVISRIVSLGLFQLVVRNEEVFHGYGFGNCGALSVIVFDLLIMVALTAYFQVYERKNWFNLLYSLLSWVVFINPVLLPANAFTIPCWLYYTIRASELFLMFGVSWKTEVWHAGGGHRFGKRENHDHWSNNNFKGLDGFKMEFADDGLVIGAFFIATALMFVLLPLLRFYFCSNVLLKDKEMFSADMFNMSQRYLCDELMRVTDKKDKEREECAKFHESCQDMLTVATDQMYRSFNNLNKEGNKSRIRKQTSVSALLSPSVSDSLLESWLDAQYSQALSDWEATKSVSPLFARLVFVSGNLHRWLKEEENFSLSDDESGIGERQHIYVRVLSVVREVLQSTHPASVEAHSRLEEPNIIKMLLQTLPEWKVRSKSKGHDLLQFQEKCNILSRIAEIGWEQQGRLFYGNALKLRDALDAHTRDEIMAANPDLDKDDLSWIMRMQMFALVTMYRAIAPAVKANETYVSCPDRGLFRKDKELTAVMDAIDLVMRQRGEEIDGSTKFVDEASNANNIKLINSAFKTDDMYFEPKWDKRWETSTLLGIMTTSHTHLKLVKLVKRPKGEDEEILQEKDLTKERLKTAIPKSFKGVIDFTFLRLPELQLQPIDRLRHNGGGWNILDTPMLHLFDALSEKNTIVSLCGDDSKHPHVTSFEGSQQRVVDDAKQMIDKQIEALVLQAKLHVHPETAVHTRLYREDPQKTQKIIGKLKQENARHMGEYEEIHDNLKEYLTRAKDKFWWSIDVAEHVEQTQKRMNDQLEKLRKAVNNYWNGEEGRLTGAAVKKEKDAKEAEEAARVREQEAQRKEEEAREASDQAKRDKADLEEKMKSEQKRLEQMLLTAEQGKEEADRAKDEAEERVKQARKKEAEAEWKIQELESKERKIRAACQDSKQTKEEDQGLLSRIAGILG